ncbi:MtN3 and saliva related transmembrane protein [Fontimonas thermophila]|uniref:MtN3 and saliva related transmembrane protein n=2 Tax=Fontimonas thermophila TaxID=1076937 RepID=A0A1I2KGS1_9GAMM|nr:MtN3 and saliva related transmembrane protein [Fontimonas thermophila]
MDHASHMGFQMSHFEWMGLLAGCLTTGAFAPQAIQILRTRRVQDISLAMYVLFSTGVALWIAYGLAIRSLSLVLFNGITLLLSGSVLVLKIKYGRRAPEQSQTRPSHG